MIEQLKYFFQPETIAIIGASDKFYSWGNWIGANLNKYKNGNVYLVNPKHKEVLGKKTYSKVVDLPEDIDLAIVIVPASQVIETLEKCAVKNTKVVTIISAGFSETTEGQDLGLELKRIKKEYGIRMQGPNCAGFYNTSIPINASPLPDEYLRNSSSVAFITQSGFVGNTLSIWGSNRHLPFGKYISVGNEADLTITDYIEYFSEDPTVQSILLYIEGIKNPGRFQRAVKKISSKKPIVVWKTSETKAVRRAALSHTAHLIGSDKIFSGLIKQLGLIRIRRLEYGLPVSHSFLRHPPLRGDRFAIMMIGAGWGIILTDTLSTAGFKVPELSEQLKSKLKEILPSYRVSVKNPIDFGAADTMEFRLMKKIIQIVFESGEIDAFIIANIGEFAPFNEEARFLEIQQAKSLKRLEKNLKKPVYLFTLLNEADSSSVSKIKRKMNMYHSMDELLAVIKSQYFYYNRLKRNKDKRI
ncbi:MAG: acetyl-CoA synthetase [Promethearchaeota archaeon]|nr:MAG: acetyl-CoA synthetase [Candidatus Lokiarchaeota archaeon]